jgi:hypothetical protein
MIYLSMLRPPTWVGPNLVRPSGSEHAEVIVCEDSSQPSDTLCGGVASYKLESYDLLEDLACFFSSCWDCRLR